MGNRTAAPAASFSAFVLGDEWAFRVALLDALRGFHPVSLRWITERSREAKKLKRDVVITVLLVIAGIILAFVLFTAGAFWKGRS